MEITAYADHSYVATWETNRELSGKKARWIEFLCEFPAKIFNRKSQLNIVSEAFSDEKTTDRLTLFLFWRIRKLLISFGRLTTKMTSFTILMHIYVMLMKIFL